jgi:four helix bundle protein
MVIAGGLPMRNEELANELEDRLIDFAVRVIRVAHSLPRNAGGRHVAGQLLRAGTAAAPNYAEARGSESRGDFAHKLKICVKELNESRVWLRLVLRAGMLKPKLLQPLIDENAQLCRVLNASVTTVRNGKVTK